MYEGRRVLAVVPARGGSKGVKLKNLRPVGGVPLVALAGKVAAQCDFIDRAVVSTDHDEIARVASEHGAEIPFRRPDDLATDTASMVAVLKHAVTWMEAEGGVDRVDFIACMQPTSPLGTPNDLDRAVQMIFDHADADAMMSVCEVEHTPYYMKKIVGGRLVPLLPDDDPLRPLQNRQLAPIAVYRPAGVVTVTRRDVLMVRNLRHGTNTLPMILGPKAAINIDHEIDFVVAESVLADNRTTGE